MTFADIARMDHAAFMAAFGGLFEHAPWVAEEAWLQRPFAGEQALHDVMMKAVRRAPASRRVEFLNGHPELAGREAEAGTMTAHSTHEQRGAGLDALTHDELRELRRLNAAYRQRHGFPFVIAVLSHTKAEIFDALRRRIAAPTDDEIDAALAQVADITRRRLRAMLQS